MWALRDRLPVTHGTSRAQRPSLDPDRPVAVSLGLCHLPLWASPCLAETTVGPSSVTRPTGPALLSLATEAARAAATVLLQHHEKAQQGGDLGVHTKSSLTDPVSVADADSEQTLVKILAAARPDDAVLGEEGANRQGRSGLRWVIDPLDGTVNYLYGHRGWAVSVAVEAVDDDGRWRGIAGVVLDPLADELFAAADGLATTLNDVAITVREPVDLPLALVATGFSYDRDHRMSQAGVASRVLTRARDVRRVGSAALDLCAVAAGRVDAYYEDSTRRWDWAAGAVVVRCAGGLTGPLPGGLPGHDGIIAAGPNLYPQIRDLVTP